jgi:hypothetical protein
VFNISDFTAYAALTAVPIVFNISEFTAFAALAAIPIVFNISDFTAFAALAAVPVMFLYSTSLTNTAFMSNYHTNKVNHPIIKLEEEYQYEIYHQSFYQS